MSAPIIPIAPCGINCCRCMAHLRKKNKCPGCRANDAAKPATRVVCKIKTCQHIQSGSRQFCFECGEFPCAVLKHLDKRYRSKYATNLIGSLDDIKTAGIEKFLADEKAKWTCPGCGGAVCIHKGSCTTCGGSREGGGEA